MSKTKIIAGIITALTLVLLIGLSNAKEPVRPSVGHIFDVKKEAKIRELKDLSLEEVFEKLKDVEFILDQDFMNKAIFTSFKNRTAQVIDYCIADLSISRTEMIDGEMQSRQDFYIATRILRVFPHKSLPRLLEFYSMAEPITRGNIIVVIGNMEGGEAIRDLLIEALDDKTVCNEQYPEMDEKPFRICDEAYNQLLLRYKIYKMKNDALRFISDDHSIDTRDHCIDLLKSIL